MYVCFWKPHRARELGEELLAAAGPLAQVRGVDAGQRLGPEADLVGDDVGQAGDAADDMDLVEHVVRELVEVGTARRLLERVVGRDDVEAVVGSGLDPGPEVGVVGGGIEGDRRRFTVAGGQREERGEQAGQQQPGETGTNAHRVLSLGKHDY